MEDKGSGKRSVNTVNGRIEARRKHWYSKQGGTVTPLDRLVDAAESTVSVGLRELACQLGRDCRSMARAQKALKLAGGLLIGEDTLRLLVESEGKAVLAAAADEQLEIDWSAAQCKTTTPAGVEVTRVYVMADGVIVPVTTQAEKDKRRATVRQRRRERGRRGVRRPRLGPVKKGADQRFKQLYLVSIHDEGQKRRLVGVTRGNHRRLGRLLRRAAASVRLPGAQQRVGMVDGAVCLRNHLEMLPLTHLGLDFYHLSEHVHEAKRLTFGKESKAGEKWAGEVLHAVRHEGYDAFWDKLVEWRCGLRGAKRKAADALMHYVAERKEMICYKELEAMGCVIGTGAMEAMCKATPLRVKGAGMRWDSDNAEAMSALEALEESGMWDKYWAKVLKDVTYAAVAGVPG
jgi:hypothetical protein